MNDDMISRRVAIDTITTEGTRLERNGTVAMAEIKQWCIDLLDALPSAQPERKKGKWIPYLPEGLRYKCSECESKYDTPWHFCPNCGSYNGGEQSD